MALEKSLIDQIPVPDSVIWRTEYRGGRRYLRDISRDELRVRVRYLAEGLRTLEPTGKLGVLGSDVPLWRAFAETHEEAMLRGESVDAFLDGAKMPTPTFPSIAPISAAYARRRDSREG